MRDQVWIFAQAGSECGVLLSELAVSLFARRAWIAAPLVRVGLVAASLGAVIGHGVAVWDGAGRWLRDWPTQQQRPGAGH